MVSKFGIPLAALLACLAFSSPSLAMTMKECSQKYQDAKKAGTLDGQDWYAFRSAQCGILPAAAAGGSNQASSSSGSQPASATISTPPSSAPASPLVAPAGLALPASIDARYAAEKPTRGRLHTCADAYHAAKKAGQLQGLKWIQKGGGFYSLCNRKLKSGS